MVDLNTPIYFGNTLYDIVVFLLLLFAGVVFGKLFNSVVKGYLKKFVGKTKTKLDDIIFESIELPSSVLIFILFFYYAIKTIILPENIYNILYSSFEIVIILCATWFVLNFVDSVIQHYIVPHVEKTESTFDDHIIVPLRKILRILIMVLGILMSINAAGYDISTLLAGLGIGGLAVALAAQDTVKNFIAGVLILIDKPFRLNHWIKFNGVEGIVEDVGLRSTKIRTFWDSLIIVPNASLLDANIENFSEMRKRRVLINIGLTYDTSVEQLKRAKEIIRDIIENHKATLPPTRITFKEFGDYSLNFRVEYFVRNFGFDYYLDTVDEINMKIKEELEKEGIEMAFPTQTVYLKKDGD
jgi:MscS family membrane protein